MNAQEKKYFQKNILKQIDHCQTEDEPLWCAGPSQNSTKNMIKCAKDSVIWKGKAMTEIEEQLAEMGG